MHMHHFYVETLPDYVPENPSKGDLSGENERILMMMIGNSKDHFVVMEKLYLGIFI